MFLKLPIMLNVIKIISQTAITLLLDFCLRMNGDIVMGDRHYFK